ncbi:MAG: HAD family phosphatase [Acidobacteria bacterium]|nr:HAD family phosphatase [Acidobacteriota bacterium]
MFTTLLVDIGQVLVGLNYDRFVDRLAAHSPLSRAEIQNYFESSPEIRSYETGVLSTQDFVRHFSSKLRIESTGGFFEELWSSLFAPGHISEQFFEVLKTHYRMVALSNTNELHFKYLLQHSPLVSRLDDYILSYQVGCMKPDRRIYEIALEKTGFRPDCVLYVDDLPRNVQSARELGIRSILFENETQLLKELRSLNQPV